MLKISDAITDIVNANPFLEFGIAYRLFNLTQLAHFIKPLVEVRTQKEVQESAILMSLSRFQRKKEKQVPKVEEFKIKNIDVYSNLCTITFFKKPETHDQVNEIFVKIREQKGFFAFTESAQEVTIFFQNMYYDLIKDHFPETLKYKNDEITCIRVRFDEKYFKVPGLLFTLMQKINLQNINLVEISSTYTEFNFYVEKKDVKLAFETLHDCFV